MSNKNIKVSVIVPVYNTELYLERCLNSILNQTFKDIELIIVNDNSNDNSHKIIETFINENNNIKYIDNKENKGVSNCRNEAIKISSGEYILFIDSDDYLDENMIETMYNEASNNDLDIAMCGYFVDYEDGNTQNRIINLDENRIYSGYEILSEILHHKNGVTGHSWNKLIKASILKENNIQYPEHMKIYEDIAFFSRLFPYCKRIKNIKKIFYHYIQRNNSSIKIIDDNIILDTEEIIKIVNKNITNLNLMSKFRDEYCAFVMRMFSVESYKLYSYSNNSDIQKKYIKRLINSDILSIRENYKIFNTNYTYDVAHKISLVSLKISNCNPKIYHIVYKYLLKAKKQSANMYKVFKSILKK